MNLQISTDIRAESKSVWATLVDVERWPEWTRSVDRVERLDDGAFGIGSRARIRQPRIPVAIWKVTEFESGRSFTWVSEAFGIRSVGTHLVEPRGEGTVSLILTIVQTGWLARLVRSRAEKTAREYLAMEAQGLKRRCEG
jgi:polyketide cyclase/dehydrase/lipid transport protein